MPSVYTPTGACAGCPYRSRCHEARQRTTELRGLGLGRHTQCEFYRAFERQSRAAPHLRPTLGERVGSLLRGAHVRRRSL